MKTYETENYSTIQPNPTYRSPIVRNKTLRNKVASNKKETNYLEQSAVLNNRIEKSFTRIIPVNNLQNDIQSAREYTRIIDTKEPKETKTKKNLKKHLSSYDIFIPKNQKKNDPASHHFTFNDMKKKKRNSSIETNQAQIKSKKPKDYSKYICDNCYNNKIATKKYKEQPKEQKEVLNNTFNKVNPFYFHDKMKDIYKDKIQHKIKELESLQRKAVSNLAKYKIENPTSIEKFQKQQELSVNPMAAHEREDPRICKTLRAYDLKENFINENREIYQIDRPRKAINDYYKKCCFQVPVLEKDYYVDQKYIKQVSIDLKEQIEEKRKNRQKIKEEEIKTERISNKQMNDYTDYLCRKNQEQKKHYLNEFYKKSKYIDDFRKYKNEQDQKNQKDYLDKINQKLKKEDEDKKYKNRQKKINEINKLQTWKKDFEIDRKNKKREKEEETHKWYNYSQDYIYKCIHGNEVAKCCLCNQPTLKEKWIRYIPKSTDISALSSKEASSQMVEKV